MPTEKTLAIDRIAIVRPPDAWFYGIDAAIFLLYRQVLLDLGVTIFEVPVDAFVSGDKSQMRAVQAELAAFRPQLAMGLPHGTYLFLCRFPSGFDDRRPNLFTDVLGIPVLCRWDHAPLDFADIILRPHPATPAESTEGALEALGRAMRHPLVIHWSRDTGQTKLMADLGFVSAETVIGEPSPTLPGFAPASEPSTKADEIPVGFIGHVYQEQPAYPHSALERLAEHAIRERLSGAGGSFWSVLLRRIEDLNPEQRDLLSLDLDDSYFWAFANRLVRYHAQTPVRLHTLGNVPGPVACYGNVSDSGAPTNLVGRPGHIPFGPELAVALARHPITIDVANPAFVNGFSHKPMLGFASGGFLLLSRKSDFIEAFGEPGEAVSYTTAEELVVKVDRFLSSPRFRQEIGDAIRESIRSRFQARDVMARVLEQSAERIGALPLETRWAGIKRNLRYRRLH